MSCEEIQTLLSELACDAAARRTLTEAPVHAQACPACAAAMNDYDRIIAELKAIGQEPAEDPANSTPPQGWEAMEALIRTGVPDEAPAAAKPHSLDYGLRSGFLKRFQSGRPGGWMAIGAAVAAALLLAVTGFAVGHFAAARSGQRSLLAAMARASQPPPPAVLAPPAADDAAEKLLAFSEINRMLDGRRRWMLLTNQDATLSPLDEAPLCQEVGTTASGATVTAQSSALGKVVLVRLKLVHGSDVISDADLLIVAGSTAELNLPATPGRSLRYRIVTSADVPERVELRAEVRIRGVDGPEAALATDVHLRADRGTDVGQLITPEGAFDLAVSYAAPL